MRFPGIWFGFEEDGVLGSHPIHGHSNDDRNQEVKRVVVTQRGAGDESGSERDTLDEPLECSEMYGELKEATIKVCESASNLVKS